MTELQNQTPDAEATIPISLRIPESLETDLKEAAKVTHLPKPEVMRQAMRLGLSVLVAALKTEPFKAENLKAS